MRNRQGARSRGRWAEGLCALWLRLRGWRILARDWRSPAGEIDLIARRGGLVAFVEVKARGSLTAAGEAVSSAQRDRIARAAALFLAQRADLAGLAVRFDVMLVIPGRLPRHLPDAWRARL